jgi:hypothetical protein
MQDKKWDMSVRHPAMTRDAPFCTRIWAALVFGFFFAAAFSSFFMLHI